MLRWAFACPGGCGNAWVSMHVPLKGGAMFDISLVCHRVLPPPRLQVHLIHLIHLIPKGLILQTLLNEVHLIHLIHLIPKGLVLQTLLNEVHLIHLFLGSALRLANPAQGRNR